MSLSMRQPPRLRSEDPTSPASTGTSRLAGAAHAADSTGTAGAADGAGVAGAVGRRDALQARIERACARIAPLWPLDGFVAVNPFLGLSDQSFEQACDTLQRVAGIGMLMPRGFYREHLASGRITNDDLRRAIEALPACSAGSASADAGPIEVGDLWRAVLDDALPAAAPGMRPSTARLDTSAATAGAATATVAEVLDRVRGTAWSRAVVEEIAKWCAAYFDHGQAAWPMPHRDRPLWAAWRAVARVDRNPQAMGLAGFRAHVASLPDDPADAVGAALDRLALPDAAVDDYLHRALLDIGGWSAYLRHRAWSQALRGGRDDSLAHLLAIRLAWDGALHALHPDAAFRQAWHDAASRAAAAASAARHAEPGITGEAAVELLLLRAFEFGYQRELITRLVRVGSGGSGAAGTAATVPAAPATAAAPTASALPGAPHAAHRAAPAVQAAFCIDVRSEVMRRCLEQVAPQVQTIGFAGFFGFPIEYVPFGGDQGSARCPVLLAPRYRVQETLRGAQPAELSQALARLGLRRRAHRAWASFKASAVSCFAYVEAAGPAFALKLLASSFGLARAAAQPGAPGLDAATASRAGPQIEPRAACDAPASCGHAPHAPHAHPSGLALPERVAAAEAMLRGMSLTQGFARLVLLAGHGSTTVNNPHATALDCGACGGHGGEANARVAAAVLNDAHVRAALAERGIGVPADTWFVAALHDTTTDEVRLFDTDALPDARSHELRQLRGWLAQAGSAARRERAARLGGSQRPQARIDADLGARSRDWSQVRPEWGLAGNAAFIAAPRRRTRALDLGGRAFLHDYDWRADADGSVLELIMTAPMVVASWINLQYYGSTVNNAAFGSGNKTLHNVVGGTLGVVQGNAGDLQAGLPLQSVHDGRGFVHEPVRLSVFVEAPRTRIERVIARHETVRQLVDHGWLHLFALDDEARRCGRYLGGLRWQDMPLSADSPGS